MAVAVHRALADAGLGVTDVDGVFAISPYFWMPSLTLAEYLGVQPRVSDSTNMGGASVVAHVGHALRAIQAGACEVAVIAYASTQRSDTGRLVTGSDALPYERPYGPLFPISSYARSSLSATCSCLVSNGGGAVVVTTADRARRLPKKPVRVLGTGESHTHRHIAAMRDFTTTAATASSAAAWEMAGLGPRDMDVVQVYDAFTINTIVGLEDLGFCAKGDGGRLIEAGTGPGSKLPVNTSGGGLAYCHPGMFGIFLLVETVRQLRGECGARQVEAARHGVAHAFGGVFSGHATVVLGSDA
ncbi:MAG: thiolase [Candidatus Rokuibacteriota bacterium]|nr:MAG: thiolase [Candidatus Rokubacteria bacterium]